MPPARRISPTPLLAEPDFWRRRLAAMEDVAPGLLILPRPDLAMRGMEVVEWRLRTHDEKRLWGLRCQSSFHVCPTGARIRVVGPTQRPEISFDAITDGRVDFVFQGLPGRKLEERVLDVLRVLRVAVNFCDIDALDVAVEGDADELMIARQVVEQGLFDLQ